MKQDVVIDFHQEQLEALYDKVLLVIETSIFAEMEQVMEAVRDSLQVLIAMEGERESLNSFMSNEDNIKRIITHVVTNYQSLRAYCNNIQMTQNSTNNR